MTMNEQLWDAQDKVAKHNEAVKRLKEYRKDVMLAQQVVDLQVRQTQRFLSSAMNRKASAEEIEGYKAKLQMLFAERHKNSLKQQNIKKMLTDINTELNGLNKLVADTKKELSRIRATNTQHTNRMNAIHTQKRKEGEEERLVAEYKAWKEGAAI